MIYSIACTISTIATNIFAGNKVGSVSRYFEEKGVVAPQSDAFAIWGIIFICLLINGILGIFDFIINKDDSHQRKIDNLKIIYCNSAIKNKNWIKQFTNSIEGNLILKDKIYNSVINIIELKTHLFRFIEILRKIKPNTIYFYDYKLKIVKIYFTWIVLATLLNFDIYNLSEEKIGTIEISNIRKETLNKLIVNIKKIGKLKLYTQEQWKFFEHYKNEEELKVISKDGINENTELTKDFYDPNTFIWTLLHFIKKIDTIEICDKDNIKNELISAVKDLLEEDKKLELENYIKDYEINGYIPSIFGVFDIFPKIFASTEK